MAKIYCAEIECKHNKNNTCRAKQINLSSANILTVFEGRRSVWVCRTFEESEEYKEIKTMMQEFFNSNRCVSCGAEIPEGSMMCPICERRYD